MSVDTELDGSVGRITINRPDVRNAITVDVNDGLHDAFVELEGKGARAAVLHGAQGSFCAGADLSVVRAAFEGNAADVLRPLVDSLHRTITRMRQVPYPVIAAVEGFAVGAGMGLALAADLRVVARSAKLVPGYFAIGASPDGGVSYFLTRALGGARAASLILRNRSLDAEEMAQNGIADEVVEDRDALQSAMELAREVANVPPLALTRMRRLIDAATYQSLEIHLADEQSTVEELWPTRDFNEGVSAFLERRKPEFIGE